MMPRGPNYPPAANGSSPNVAPAMPNGHGQAGSIGQMRPGPPIARLPNGTQVPSSLPTTSQGVPHAPMQPQMQVQQRLPAQMMTDNARIFQEATRLQEQQRRYLAAQTQHQHPQSNGNSTSPPTMTHLNALNQNNAALQSNTAIYGGLQGRSGSPSVNGTPVPSGASSSPRMTNPSQPQPLSSGMVPVVNQVQNQIKARHPQASPEQVKAMTTESLHQYRMNQAAMQAAAGNPNATGMANHSSLNGLPSQPQQGMMNGINGSPMLGNARAQYAAMVHNHQAQQSRGSGGGISAPRPASRSATPQTHPGHAPSQSPRPAQAQMATGQ
jgi:chromatin modification-related protein VID21